MAHRVHHYPLGLQNFEEIRKGGYCYVDKTEIIYRLISSSARYFLSRPRRFGKSLLLSTLKSLFLGKRELFEGLWIAHADYGWEVYPVIHLDFSMLLTTSLSELIDSLEKRLQDVANEYSLGEIREGHPPETLKLLVDSLSKQGKVVFLIDEYDKPMLDVLEQKELLQGYRALFKTFFTYAKGLSHLMHCIFITGVSKFAQVSLFSGMNNLQDISFDYQASTLLGITEEELQRYFLGDMEAIAKNRGVTIEELSCQVRARYDGYRFSRHPEACAVYNPLSLMNFLGTGELANYWFATATPTFAFELIQRQNFDIPAFEKEIVISSRLERIAQTDTFELIPLLYQTGYLTIGKYEAQGGEYFLRFPNEEVKESFFEDLLMHFAHIRADATLYNLKEALKQNAFESFFETFNTFLASIPYVLHVGREAYYHSILYLLLKVLGLSVHAEVMVATGRIDLLVTLGCWISLFEFKFGGTPEEALMQIRSKNYHAAYGHSQKKVQLIGAVFDVEQRMIIQWLREEC